jgi:L-serine dehydratase
MKATSIFNDVLGPVMRRPSSSHTAGSHRIGTLARSLLGDEPLSARFVFDADGSYFQVFREQGADLALAAGLMGWPITDERFAKALEHAAAHGLRVEFDSGTLEDAGHPNAVDITLQAASGRSLRARASSTGGGRILFSSLESRPVELTGEFHEVLLEADRDAAAAARRILDIEGTPPAAALSETRIEKGMLLVHCSLHDAPAGETIDRLRALPGLRRLWTAPPLLLVQRGEPLFSSAAEMTALAAKKGWSLGRLGLAYESRLLGITETEATAEMRRRLDVMTASVREGLRDESVHMRLLKPSAGRIMRAEAKGKLAVGGLHTRAAARAMAVMHVNGSDGILCAAPTGGGGGALPGVVVTLMEDRDLTVDQAVAALFAAGAIGVVVGERATFAAEVAGCQVEIGAAGAMAAAAVVEAACGTPRQAANAAAVSFQNTMGSVCDLVQGIVEIPCHTRNAAAASSAFVCADLVLGGYENGVPLDETVDTVLAVGKMLPPELRVTARGGLAKAPSAETMKRLR